MIHNFNNEWDTRVNKGYIKYLKEIDKILYYTAQKCDIL